MCVNYDDFTRLFGDMVPEVEFPHLNAEAMRIMNRATTGIDNVKKLVVAFPEDEDDVRAVMMCACKIILLLYQIESASKNASRMYEYEQTENGMVPRIIASVSAGNESISYANGSSDHTYLSKAVSDPAEKMNQINTIIREYLSGVTDKNGVNLLYGGRYPSV